eukprot:gene19887-28155_t
MSHPPSRDPMLDETWDRLNALSTLFVKLVWHLDEAKSVNKSLVIADIDAFLATFEAKPNPGLKRYIEVLKASVDGSIDGQK